MKDLHPLAGIYAAAVTPLQEDGSLDHEAIPAYLKFLAERGCHGCLLLGTTGEGPSFNQEERVAVWETAVRVRKANPEFRLLAATGTPSLSESVQLSQAAFELGMEAVVVLPPFYFRNAGEEGLFDWFAQVLEASVPEGKFLLGYHIPQVSGVGLSFELLERLQAAFPQRFAGLKDSSGDLEHAKGLVELLPGKAVLVGNDRLLGPGLSAGASGAITALANLRSPLLREIWEAHLVGESTETLQEALSRSRTALDQNPSAQAFLKALLHELHGFPRWALRPPLRGFEQSQVEKAKADYEASRA